MADVSWDEIRSLRADFLNLQLTEASNKLSERNCVELIGLLVKEGFLSVVYTTDGKDIITEQRLIREILDEIYANGGRINIVDLAQHLKIDLSYIEGKIGDVCKEDPTLQFTLGQFISVEYTNRLVEEITDMLTERGLVPMNELLRQLDLPTEYFNSILVNRIVGASGIKFESGTLYTENYVRLQQNILIGCLEAAFLPLRVSEVIKHTRVNENLVQNLIVNLIRDNRIRGSLVGTTKENAIFYPKVYTDAQAKYIESFFAQNGYLEYSLVRNLGISDPEGQTKLVLKDRYDANKLLFLTSGCVDLSKFLPQLEMNIEQGLVSNEYVDISTLVPNSFTETDIEKLLKSEASVIEQIQSLGGELLSSTFVLSKELQDKIDKKLTNLCEEYAEKELTQCTPQMYAAVIQGNVALGTSSKGASGKKPTASGGKRKGAAAKFAEEMSANQETITFVSTDEIKTQIRAVNEELPDEIVDLLADNLHRSKSRQFLDLFVRRVKESFAARDTEASSDTTRKSVKNVQDTLKQLHGNICVFSRSIEQLTAENETALNEALQRHLIRSLCADMCDILIREIDTSAAGGKIGALSNEERAKVIQKMSEPNRAHLTKVNEALNGKNVETALARIEDAASELLQLPLKRPNKKTEKDLTVEIREKLKAKLTEEQDPAMILHLTTTLIFYGIHGGRLVHAPGKAVPLLIRYLAKSLPVTIHQRLVEVQDYVIQQSTTTAPAPVAEDKIEYLKKLGLNAKENMTFPSSENDNR